MTAPARNRQPHRGPPQQPAAAPATYPGMATAAYRLSRPVGRARRRRSRGFQRSREYPALCCRTALQYVALRQRQCESKHGTPAELAFHRQMAAMQIEDALGDREPKPRMRTFLPSRIVHAEEAFENQSEVVLCDADPGIGHLHQGGFPIDCDVKPLVPILRRMRNGIADQILQNTFDQADVADHE